MFSLSTNTHLTSPLSSSSTFGAPTKDLLECLSQQINTLKLNQTSNQISDYVQIINSFISTTPLLSEELQLDIKLELADVFSNSTSVKQFSKELLSKIFIPNDLNLTYKRVITSIFNACSSLFPMNKCNKNQLVSMLLSTAVPILIHECVSNNTQSVMFTESDKRILRLLKFEAAKVLQESIQPITILDNGWNLKYSSIDENTVTQNLQLEIQGQGSFRQSVQSKCSIAQVSSLPFGQCNEISVTTK